MTPAFFEVLMVVALLIIFIEASVKEGNDK